jgi:hypothetical protein
MTNDLNAFATFPDHSRTWVYQCSRQLTPDEADAVKAMAREFVAGWKAHGQPLRATADVLFDRFLIMMVDEDAAHASGCSIDTSVAFVRSLENRLNANFFDRLQLAYVTADGAVNTIHADRIAQAVELGEMNADTIVFNNMVSSKDALMREWRIPLSQSWAASRADLTANA